VNPADKGGDLEQNTKSTPPKLEPPKPVEKKEEKDKKEVKEVKEEKEEKEQQKKPSPPTPVPKPNNLNPGSRPFHIPSDDESVKPLIPENPSKEKKTYFHDPKLCFACKKGFCFQLRKKQYVPAGSTEPVKQLINRQSARLFMSKFVVYEGKMKGALNKKQEF
jgi:hypothetical protein